MDITETLYVRSGEEWRNWLEKNHKNKKIWLVFYRKHTGKPGISNEDAKRYCVTGWTAFRNGLTMNKYSQTH